MQVIARYSLHAVSPIVGAHVLYGSTVVWTGEAGPRRCVLRQPHGEPQRPRTIRCCTVVRRLIRIAHLGLSVGRRRADSRLQQLGLGREASPLRAADSGASFLSSPCRLLRVSR